MKKAANWVALLAPSVRAALTFEHADGFSTPGIQNSAYQARLCIAARAPVVFMGLRGGAFRHG